MLKSLMAALVFSFPVITHQAIAVAPAAASQGVGAVVFAPKVVDMGTHCLVGFIVTYPQDITPHGRHVRVSTMWSEESQDDIWRIPSRGAPDSFVHNPDNTVTFSGGMNDSIGGCDPELTARTLAIGPCAEGDCPEARFVPDEAVTRFGLREAGY